MLQEVSHAPAGAVRADPDRSGEVAVPLPAPDTVGGNTVSLSDLIDVQVGTFDLGFCRHIMSYARAWREHRTRSIGPPIHFRSWDCRVLTKEFERRKRLEPRVSVHTTFALPLAKCSPEVAQRPITTEFLQLTLIRNLNKTREFKWCPEPESNQRHADFQSAALPTELSGHRWVAA